MMWECPGDMSAPAVISAIAVINCDSLMSHSEDVYFLLKFVRQNVQLTEELRRLFCMVKLKTNLLI